MHSAQQEPPNLTDTPAGTNPDLNSENYIVPYEN
jgi:hypothetical protein